MYFSDVEPFYLQNNSSLYFTCNTVVSQSIKAKLLKNSDAKLRAFEMAASYRREKLYMKKNFMSTFFVLFIILAIIPVTLNSLVNKSVVYASQRSRTPSSANFSDSFEKSLNNRWNYETADLKYSYCISNKYARVGNYSLRIELRNTDPDVNDSKRSEIALLPRELPNEEHWYSFSTYLPSTTDEDYSVDPNSSEIIAQWHNYPDEGEEWTSPPLSLETRNGHYFVNRCWDPAPITSNVQISKNNTYSESDIGSYIEDKGKWTDWTFHVKWGWLDSHSPKLEVYKNNVKILDCNGLPNMTNDQSGVYMKLGVYKWDWKQQPENSILSRRIIYYDNVRIDNTKPSNLP